jgi:hypothetical protein
MHEARFRPNGSAPRLSNHASRNQLSFCLPSIGRHRPMERKHSSRLSFGPTHRFVVSCLAVRMSLHLSPSLRSHPMGFQKQTSSISLPGSLRLRLQLSPWFSSSSGDIVRKQANLRVSFVYARRFITFPPFPIHASNSPDLPPFGINPWIPKYVYAARRDPSSPPPPFSLYLWFGRRIKPQTCPNRTLIG